MSLSLPGRRVEEFSPFTHIPSHDDVGHVVQLYTNDEYLIDVLSRFIGGALAVGDATVVIATASHRIALEQRLAERGMDLSKPPLQRRYIMLDANETLATIHGRRFG